LRPSVLAGAASLATDPWWRRTLLLVLGVTLARVLYLVFLCPYTLIEDEAHYWEWSRRLEWSYYTKGPGVAWSIAAATRLLGDHEFAVRLPAVDLLAQPQRLQKKRLRFIVLPCAVRGRSAPPLLEVSNRPVPQTPAYPKAAAHAHCAQQGRHARIYATLARPGPLSFRCDPSLPPCTVVPRATGPSGRLTKLSA
jgi:hypothetical protein